MNYLKGFAEWLAKGVTERGLGIITIFSYFTCLFLAMCETRLWSEVILLGGSEPSRHIQRSLGVRVEPLGGTLSLWNSLQNRQQMIISHNTKTHRVSQSIGGLDCGFISVHGFRTLNTHLSGVLQPYELTSLSGGRGDDGGMRPPS